MIEDVNSVSARENLTLELNDESLEFLLFDFIQLLVYHKDADQLLLRVPQMQFQQSDGKWTLRAAAEGERLAPQRHRQIVDVKAVTFHGFRLEEQNGKWRAHVLLDI